MFGYKCLWPSRVLCFTDSFDYRVDLWRAGCMVRQNVLLWSKHTKRGINCRFIFFIHDVAILVSWRGLIIQMIVRNAVHAKKEANIILAVRGFGGAESWALF